MAGLNSLEVKAEVMRLLGDNCTQSIRARELREALITVFENATGVVSPVYMKSLTTDFDEMGMDLLNHSLQVTMEKGNQELKIFDENRNTWLDVFSEAHIKELIAAASKFEGVVAETGHSQGTGVKQLSDLATMMGTLTDAEKLLLTSHYYSWNGADGYIITATDLGGELDGKIMQTNDWLQMVNTGGKITDPNDPLYATEKPEMHLVQISGDNLSKSRADGLYSFNLWHHSAYEEGSIVTYMGKAYTSKTAILSTDNAPTVDTHLWQEIDLGGTSPMTYFGRGGFDFAASSFGSFNHWGMPTGTHPNPSKRHVHGGDRYIDLDHGSEVDFTMDPVTHVISATHTFGHTRAWEYDVASGVSKTDAFKVLTCDINETAMYEVDVVDKEDDSASFSMRLMVSGAGNSFLVPIAVDAHNSKIEIFSIGEDATGLSLLMDMDDTSVAKKYDIVIHSSDVNMNTIIPFPSATDKLVSMQSLGVINALQNFPSLISSGGGNPIGTIIQYVSYTPPQGHLLCDGTTFDRNKFPLLFQILGVDKLPDLRNEFIRGASSQSQITGFTKHRWTTARPRTQFKTNDDGLHRHSFVTSTTSYGDDGEGKITSGGESSSNQSINGTTMNTAGNHHHYINYGGDAETAPDHIRLAYHIKAL